MPSRRGSTSSSSAVAIRIVTPDLPLLSCRTVTLSWRRVKRGALSRARPLARAMGGRCTLSASGRLGCAPDGRVGAGAAALCGSSGLRSGRGRPPGELFGPSGTPRVVVIGAGIGGIATGVKLLRAGIETFTVYESSPGVGGTWWDNTYPGAEVDVPSNLYSYSFKPYGWTRTHARQPELQSHPRGDRRRVRLAPSSAAGRERAVSDVGRRRPRLVGDTRPPALSPSAMWSSVRWASSTSPGIPTGPGSKDSRVRSSTRPGGSISTTCPTRSSPWWGPGRRRPRSCRRYSPR